MLGNDLQIHMRTEVELPDESFAVERLVAATRTSQERSAAVLRQIVGRRFPNHSISTNTIHAESPDVKCLTECEKSGVGIAIRQTDLTVSGAEQ